MINRHLQCRQRSSNKITKSAKHEGDRVEQQMQRAHRPPFPLPVAVVQPVRLPSHRSALRLGMKQYSPPRVTTNLGMACRRRRTGRWGIV